MGGQLDRRLLLQFFFWRVWMDWVNVERIEGELSKRGYGCVYLGVRAWWWWELWCNGDREGLGECSLVVGVFLDLFIYCWRFRVWLHYRNCSRLRWYQKYVSSTVFLFSSLTWKLICLLLTVITATFKIYITIDQGLNSMQCVHHSRSGHDHLDVITYFEYKSLRLLDIPWMALLLVFVTFLWVYFGIYSLRMVCQAFLAFLTYKTDLCLSRNTVVIQQPDGTLEVANDLQKLGGAGLAF